MKPLFYLLIAVFIVVLFSLQAFSSVNLLVDTFENGNITSDPTWTVTSAVGGDADINSFTAASGTYSMLLRTDAVDDDNLLSVETGAFVDQPIYRMRWFVRTNSDAAGGALALLDSGDNQIFRVAFSGGNYRYNADSAANLFNVTHDTWYRIDVNYNFADDDLNFTGYANDTNAILGTATGIATANNTRPDVVQLFIQDTSLDVHLTHYDWVTYGAISVDANFVHEVATPLDPQNGVNSVLLDFNNFSVGTGVTPTDWNWLVDSVIVSTDQNFVHSFDVVQDFNVCLQATGVSEADTFFDMSCQDVNINQHTQNIDFSVFPVLPVVDTNTVFTFTSDNDENISQASWDFGDGTSFFDLNSWRIFPASSNIDLNVCVNVLTVRDVNTVYCEPLAVAPILRLEFHDENSYVAISPSVSFDGNTFTVNKNGKIDVNVLSPTTRSYTLTAFEDNNYGIRFFEFDLNKTFDRIDLNLFLLSDVNGTDINFQFFDTDQATILPNARVRVFHDLNLVSMRETDGTGNTSFFLGGDNNYVFEIEPSAGGAARVYHPTKLTVLVPKDESSLALITPYSLTVSGLLSDQNTNMLESFELFILSNTVEHYIFDVNAGLEYFSRRYFVNLRGNPVTATLQPYLVKLADGIQVTFFTRTALDFETVPDILIKVFKTISGEGRVEVEVIKTDDAGTAILSFIQDDQYDFEFFDSDGNFLFTKTLIVNFAEYHVYIDLEEITTLTETTLEAITVGGLPRQGYIIYDGDGFDFNITVTVEDGNLLSTWFTVFNDDGNLNTNDAGDLNFNDGCGAACGFHLTKSDLNSTKSIGVRVYIQTVDGLIYDQTWIFTPLDTTGFNLMENLKSAAFKESLGCSADANEPCFPLLVVVLFIIMGLLFTAGNTLTSDRASLAIISLVAMGMFTYLTWVPIGFLILAGLATFASIVITRRFG